MHGNIVRQKSKQVPFCPPSTSGPIFAHLPFVCGIFAVLKKIDAELFRPVTS